MKIKEYNLSDTILWIRSIVLYKLFLLVKPVIEIPSLCFAELELWQVNNYLKKRGLHPDSGFPCLATQQGGFIRKKWKYNYICYLQACIWASPMRMNVINYTALSETWLPWSVPWDVCRSILLVKWTLQTDLVMERPLSIDLDRFRCLVHKVNCMVFILLFLVFCRQILLKCKYFCLGLDWFIGKDMCTWPEQWTKIIMITIINYWWKWRYEVSLCGLQVIDDTWETITAMNAISNCAKKGEIS